VIKVMIVIAPQSFVHHFALNLMTAASSSRLLLKFLHPSAVKKKTVRDHDDREEGIAVAAHDAIDDSNVSKRPSHELQPLTEVVDVPLAMSSFRADKRSAEACWNSFDFRTLKNIVTVGLPKTKVHEHPLGLTQVIFDNCIVKVRKGCDLERIQALGRVGQVKLSNVSSCGWVTTDKTLLPCCVFNRWMSSMSPSAAS
jgi:hypothetical protein